MVKVCAGCGQTKDMTEYYTDNPPRNRKNHKCKNCIKLRVREYYKTNKDVTRNSNFKKKFGISLEIYDKMHKEQNGLCAICQKPSPTTSRLSVDHDHKTGKVRQLLCANHNSMLGFANEDTEVLKSAISYIEKHLVA